jgi:sugar/nucleoside kinase (ribokinase family)
MKKYDVIGIGNAIVDCLAYVDESFLQRNNMKAGSMQLISAEVAQDLLRQLGDYKICSGGSVANSIAALASLNAPSALLGRVAHDDLGAAFTDDIQEVGVYFNPNPAKGGKPTACCIICVTPDGERTMNTFIGASSEFTLADVDAELIAESKILYLEGYLWDAEPAKEAILHAIHVAKDNDVKVAFSASDAFCVNRHHGEFVHLIERHVDILFANEDEAKALLQTDKFDVSQFVQQFAAEGKLRIITRSSTPAVVIEGSVVTEVAPVAGIKMVDATGAGDLFAAGFLYAHLRLSDVVEAAELGHKLAGHIIQQLGARSETPLLSLVN